MKLIGVLDKLFFAILVGLLLLVCIIQSTSDVLVYEKVISEDFLYQNYVSDVLGVVSIIAGSLFTLQICYSFYTRSLDPIKLLKSKPFPVVTGIIIASLIAPSIYRETMIMDDAKQPTRDLLNRMLTQTANTTFNFSTSEKTIDSILEKELFSSSDTKISLKISPETLDHIKNTEDLMQFNESKKSPNEVKGWLKTFDKTVNSFDGLKGFVHSGISETLQKELGEKLPISAYVKKTDFTKTNSLSLHSFTYDGSIPKCATVKYRVTYSSRDKARHIGQIDNCEEQSFGIPELRIGKKSSGVSLKDNDNDIESIEVWVTISPIYYTSKGININSFSVLDYSENQFPQFCLEGYHEGIPNEKFKAVVKNKFYDGFSVSTIESVTSGSCRSVLDY